VEADESKSAAIGEGLYSAEWTERTYAECLRRAGELLFEGRRVIVDATFGDESRRQAYLDAARRWAVPAVLFVCEADAATARRRIDARSGDASDATWSVYQHGAERWQPLGHTTRRAAVTVRTEDSPERAEEAALAALRSRQLL
jgi:predicted kinase